MTAILLFIIGALLIALNLKAIRKDKEKFQSVLHNVSDDIKDYDLEIGKLKKEFAETIMEIQLEIEDLKDKLKAEDKSTEKNVQNVVIEKENKVYKNVEIGHIDDKVSEVNDREINNVKIDDIEKFMKKGMSIDHISEELGIGKGEILLIKKLYLK